jgi:PIN domain nuclease of toxin-antitoxin system
MLEAKGRVQFTTGALDFCRAGLSSPGVRLEPVTPEIAVGAARLEPGLHGDPADRLIVATALAVGAPIVTRDAQIRNSKLVETVW